MITTNNWVIEVWPTERSGAQTKCYHQSATIIPLTSHMRSARPTYIKLDLTVGIAWTHHYLHARVVTAALWRSGLPAAITSNTLLPAEGRSVSGNHWSLWPCQSVITPPAPSTTGTRARKSYGWKDKHDGYQFNNYHKFSCYYALSVSLALSLQCSWFCFAFTI
jgi:hypothetical protein